MTLPATDVAETRSLPARIHTPDVETVDADGHKSTRFTLQRACNGCGSLLGDVDNRDVDLTGNRTDVRPECAGCAPLVALEAAGCKTWRVTPRSIIRVDNEIDRYGIYAKGYWQEVDGKLTVVGLRVGQYLDSVVAFFGDWLVRHPDGRWSVHKGPQADTAPAVTAVPTGGRL